VRVCIGLKKESLRLESTVSFVSMWKILCKFKRWAANYSLPRCFCGRDVTFRIWSMSTEINKITLPIQHYAALRGHRHFQMLHMYEVFRFSSLLSEDTELQNYKFSNVRASYIVQEK
jgi:hypothetical protein